MRWLTLTLCVVWLALVIGGQCRSATPSATLTPVAPQVSATASR
jgi:hypothetical protein